MDILAVIADGDGGWRATASSDDGAIGAWFSFSLLSTTRIIMVHTDLRLHNTTYSPIVPPMFCKGLNYRAVPYILYFSLWIDIVPCRQVPCCSNSQVLIVSKASTTLWLRAEAFLGRGFRGWLQGGCEGAFSGIKGTRNSRAVNASCSTVGNQWSSKIEEKEFSKGI